MEKNIILTGGGTAGHIMPNIALIPHLKKNFNNIYYIGSKEGIEKKLITNLSIPYFEITTTKLNRSFNLKNFLIPFKLCKGVKESLKLIDKLKPSIIFSKGGFVSLPVSIAAKKRHIPLILHESDLTLGLANRLSLKRCSKLLTSFEETSLKYENAIFTGSAIRENLFKFHKETEQRKLGFLNGKKTILVLCGSTGSVSINKVILSSLDNILSKYNLIHITGKNFNERINKKGYFQLEFTSDIGRYIEACDIIISRSGSNSIFEFLSFKKPMLLIPLSKKVSRGDQILNAKYFVDKGFAISLEEDKLSTSSLLNNLDKLDKNSYKYISNMENCNFTNGTTRILNEIIKSTK